MYKIFFSLVFFASNAVGKKQEISNFSVVHTFVNSVHLKWDPVANATLYKVFAMDPELKTVVTNSTVNSALVVNLKPNTLYGFAVNVLEINHASIGLNEISSPILLWAYTNNKTSPDITNITAIDATQNSLRLIWNPVRNATLYKVLYLIDGSVNQTQNVLTSNATIELKNLFANTTYRIKLFVVEINGIISNDLLQSDNLFFNTLREKEKVKILPLNLTVSNITSKSVFVNWDAIENATSYNVMYVTNFTRGNPFNRATNFTHMNITNLESGTEYEITVYVSEIQNMISKVPMKSSTLVIVTNDEKLSKKSSGKNLHSEIMLKVFLFVTMMFIIS